jgi:GxxExxY protein
VDGDTHLSGEVLGAAFEVHAELGAGLLESVYRICLVQALRKRGLHVETEVSVPVRYGGLELESAYRLDLVVASRLIVEVKSVQALNEIHTAQVLTYLRFMKVPVGLLINFNTVLLKHGIRRIVLGAT